MDWKWILSSCATSISFKIRHSLSGSFPRFLFLFLKRFTGFSKQLTVIFYKQQFRSFFFSFLLRFAARFLCFRNLNRLPVLFEILFYWDLFIIYFLSILETWGFGSFIAVLFFMEHFYLRFQRFFFQKPHSVENCQLNLTDQLKICPLKRKYSLNKSVFSAHFSEKKF